MSKKYQIFKQVDFKKVSTPTELGQRGGRRFEHTGSFSTPRSDKVRSILNDNGIISFYKVNR
jgi:hypothetical protein